MTAVSAIYAIVAPSGHRYVGSAADLNRRWAKHRRDIRMGVHGNCNLQRAAAKYSIDALDFRVLIVCRRCDLLLYEQVAIDAINPEYNIARFAGNGIGIKRSAAFKAKVSAAGKGRIFSEETRAKIGAKHKGKKIAPHQIKAMMDGLAAKPHSIGFLRSLAAHMHTPEAKAKKAAAMIGRPVSAETRARISAALTGRSHSAERRANILAGQRRARKLQNA